MQEKKLQSKLIKYIDAGFPIIYINTFEEDKIDSIIKKIKYRKEVVEWNESDGYIDFDTRTPFREDVSLEMVLNELKILEILENKIVLIKDANEYLNDYKIVSKIKGLVKLINQGVEATIIIISNIIKIPKELEKFITILEMDYLESSEIKKIILDFLKEYEIEGTKEKLINELTESFKGLTEFEILNLLALAYAENGELAKNDLNLIFEQKQQMIKKAGILDMIPFKETIDDIGGLENLKEWFIRKSKVYKNIDKAIEFGVDMPKGVLIVGIAGCGKSLSAKAAANLFEVPLLRLDMGRIMGKYVGESEANFRQAIGLAEAIAPCVLWVDELEKAFAGIGEASASAEITTRLFGNFLTWMQEKTSQTFVVATANDISKIPSELLRKGRFDEIFYVDLPNDKEREHIFNIHINKRRVEDLKNIKISQLASKTQGFSGADIESVVKEAVETAFTNGKDKVETSDIIKAIENTNSISEIMKQSLEILQKQYKTRKFKNASK